MNASCALDYVGAGSHGQGAKGSTVRSTNQLELTDRRISEGREKDTCFVCYAWRTVTVKKREFLWKSLEVFMITLISSRSQRPQSCAFRLRALCSTLSSLFGCLFIHPCVTARETNLAATEFLYVNYMLRRLEMVF